MMTDRHALTYNVKAVVRATGLTPDTLRAWERRYGLPQPPRTAGGHRLYSQHHIDVLKWLVARQREGMSISRAVDLWRQLEAQGVDPLHDEAAAPAVTPPTSHALDDIRQDWLRACLAFDEARTSSVLSQAFALYPVESVCVEVLGRALREIGDGWYEGAISVQQEHFASELSSRWLDRLLALAPASTRPHRVLLGCPPEEQHTFGLHLLALGLRWRSLDVLFLGANVPLEQLDATVAETKPSLVVLAAQRLRTAATLVETATLLRRLGVRVAYAGRIFGLQPSIRHLVPGHFLGSAVASAPEEVERLLATGEELSPIVATPEACGAALAAFREAQPRIERDLLAESPPDQVSPTQQVIAVENLGQLIASALALGDLSFLDAEVDWIRGLLAHRGTPPLVVDEFLAAYRRAASAHLGSGGGPVQDWLAGQTTR